MVVAPIFVCPLQPESNIWQFKWKPALHQSRIFFFTRDAAEDDSRLRLRQACPSPSVQCWSGETCLAACLLQILSESIPHNLSQTKPNPCWRVKIFRLKLTWCQTKLVGSLAVASETRFPRRLAGRGHTWLLPIWTTSQFNLPGKYFVKAHQPDKIPFSQNQLLKIKAFKA